MKIDVRTTLDGAAREEAWTLYETAFADLNALTIQRHLMHRHEFDDVCEDPRIEKWLLVNDDGHIVGLSAYTNELDAWGLISPAYFARRWPAQYAAKTIWYCGFVTVSPNAFGGYGLLIKQMFHRVKEVDGVISLDFCRRNERLARIVALQMMRMSGGACDSAPADEQTFWVYQPNGSTAVAAA